MIGIQPRFGPITAVRMDPWTALTVIRGLIDTYHENTRRLLQLHQAPVEPEQSN